MMTRVAPSNCWPTLTINLHIVISVGDVGAMVRAHGYYGSRNDGGEGTQSRRHTAAKKRFGRELVGHASSDARIVSFGVGVPQNACIRPKTRPLL